MRASVFLSCSLFPSHLILILHWPQVLRPLRANFELRRRGENCDCDNNAQVEREKDEGEEEEKAFIGNSVFRAAVGEKSSFESTRTQETTSVRTDRGFKSGIRCTPTSPISKVSL